MERKGRRNDPDSRYDFLFSWTAHTFLINKQDLSESLGLDPYVSQSNFSFDDPTSIKPLMDPFRLVFLVGLQVQDVHDFFLRDAKRTTMLFHQKFHADWGLGPGRRPAVINEERPAPLEGAAVFFMKFNLKKILTDDNTHRVCFLRFRGCHVVYLDLIYLDWESVSITFNGQFIFIMFIHCNTEMFQVHGKP